MRRTTTQEHKMTTQQIAQTLISGRRMVGGWLIGLTLLALAALLVAGWQTMPAPARQATASQPVVGRAITVTGLVSDGTRYVNAPITIGANLAQPIVGRAITVTGLVFDGTRYVSAPVAIGAPRAGQGYAVTTLVYDGTTYRSAPVQVGGH
jgi:hypothetical protein